MPYTPPSQRSPAASTESTPNVSRSNSYMRSLDHPAPGVGYFKGPRPGLPRSSSSTSYLNRERRSPQAPREENPSPELTPVLEKGNIGFKSPRTIQPGSLRQSPPPVNNNLIPTGAVISPPDSTQNSSDDEESSRGRPRRLDNLEELQAAIRTIEQRRDGSPDRETELKPKLTLEVTSPSPQPSPSGHVISPPLSKEARKISHSRSSTESNIVEFPRSMESPERSSDEDLEMARINKPPMVRKKSGELVRPALRPKSAQRRPSSMPGTPTYDTNKNVHFSTDLEHVRTFNHSERPAAVSAGSSPVEAYDSETEFPFEVAGKREAPWQWEIQTPNFPTSPERKDQPVMVERIYLSNDKKFLIGSVIVKNWGFHKSVVARFTLDYWKTTSEVAAEFSHDVRKEIAEGCDRFMFNIKLADQTNLENKTLFFCVRYNVNGQEFWDSNSMMNFQVEFSKKNIPQRGKNGMLGAQSKSMTSLSSLPRSHAKRSVGLPTFDDFAHHDGPFALGSPPTAASLIGEKPIKFRQKSIVPGSFGVQSKAAQAFGNRYDFGASLSATKNGSPTFSDLKPTFAPGTAPEVTPTKPGPKQVTAVSSETPKPAALSEKPDLASRSYQELVDKYCFFGTAKSSPTIQRSGNDQTDGASDDIAASGDNDLDFESKQDVAALEKKKNSPRSSATSTAMNSPLGPRGASPLGYPFPQSMQGSLFDPQTPTAILS